MSLWHFVQVDEIVVPVETQIIDLLGQDEGTEQAESERVESFVARARRSDTEQQTQCENMEEYAHDAVVDVDKWILVSISRGGALIRDDAERQKVAVRAKEQVHVNSRHVVPNKLVYDEVKELRALEADEPFDFWTALNGTLIVDEPADHELRHNGSLDANPDLLDDVAGRARILFVHALRGRRKSNLEWHNLWVYLLNWTY